MMAVIGATISVLMLGNALEWMCYDYWDACYIVSDYAMSFVDAESFCVDMGVELASVHSAVEDCLLTHVCGGKDCWIGLNDADTEGEWVWTDGSDVDYLNWSPGQPDDYKGIEDYVGK